MISINLTLIIQMVNFLVFLFLMNLSFVPSDSQDSGREKEIDLRKQEGIDHMEAQSGPRCWDLIRSFRKPGERGPENSGTQSRRLRAGKGTLARSSAKTAGQVQKMRAKIQKDIACCSEGSETADEGPFRCNWRKRFWGGAFKCERVLRER